MAHITVLESESVTALALNENSVVVDCTLGSGGHARAILRMLGPNGVYIGFDVDKTAIEAQASLETEFEATVVLIHSNFADIQEQLQSRNLKPTAILADLGWRSEQFEEGNKGFSFNYDEPLLMTFGEPEQYPYTALDIVNDWEVQSITDILEGYGEERSAFRIANAIVAAREEGPIKTSGQLAEIVSAAVPAFRLRSRTHPATKTFQALRITVNDELGVLRTLLKDCFELLEPEGRLAVISFHSLEDRIVKRFTKDKARDQLATLVNKRPIIASDEELEVNPRSRSAKLRILEKN